MHRSFTLIELVMVIVILGITGVMTSDIISHVYRNYALQRFVSEMELQSKVTLEIIEKHITRAIPSSIIDGNVNELSSISYLERNDTGILKWIGKDIESLQGIWKSSGKGSNRNYPAYSGFLDLERSSGTDMNTTDCNVDNISTLQNILSGITTWESGGYYRSALYFPYASSDGTISSRYWENNGTTCSGCSPTSLFPISGVSDSGNDTTGILNQQIQLAKHPEEIGEKYYLSHSAYAIKLENSELHLYDNFRPWNQCFGSVCTEDNDLNVRQNLLAENVKSFEFWGESLGSILRIRLCFEDTLPGESDPVEFCKEVAVLL